MRSFPLIEELPPVVETLGWSWERFNAPSASSDNFWLGVDRQGNRWITKLRGSFYAYREIVFARLAQKMKWSCQSTVFMKLDERSAQTLGVTAGEIHAAHWFLDEHVYHPCSHGCPIEFLVNMQLRTVEDLLNSHVSHLLDWPKSEISAYLFGGNEPPGRLFTKAHEFVIIDSELMFSTIPCPFDSLPWMSDSEGHPSCSGNSLVLEVCQDLASLSALEIEEALKIPASVAVQETWPVAPILHASRRHADEFVRNTIRLRRMW
jgi:hypothetical protein